MRSQATKPLSKKGALGKTASKATSATKQAKKKVVSKKKVNNLVKKSIVKNPKKKSSKNDVAKTDGESSTDDSDKSNIQSEITKPGPSKSNSFRSESPSKKIRKEPKEKKDAIKSTLEINVKKVVPKKVVKSTKKPNITAKPSTSDSDSDNDDIKYKINMKVVKKVASKFSKAKKIVKRGNATSKKKNVSQKKQQIQKKQEILEQKSLDIAETLEGKGDQQTVEAQNKSMNVMDDAKEDLKPDKVIETKHNVLNTPSSMSTPQNQTETPKSETERPPKFFTSTRSPRIVDIDVKCCKNSKGNLSVSERFLKCESKSDDNNKDKNASNTLISQGSEIDVYTFTEKVDSPKSILSDFRSPLNKNVGRVRPIARVKGTVIDKKMDSDKKKYSPHRPIEEVVKQLKANKRSEEVNVSHNTNNFSISNINSTITSSEKEFEDKPKPIVSKSYKMVARKSSITGKPFSPIKFLDQEPLASKSDDVTTVSGAAKKFTGKPKKQQKESTLSDDELDSCKFSLNTKTRSYTSSEESVSESNDDTKDSSDSDSYKTKKAKNKKYKRITDSVKKTTSKELKELSKDSLIDLKDDSLILGSEKPSKRRLKLLSMWSGPKKHRMASLNAIAKVHCLYENESRTHMELGLMKTVDRQVIPSTSKSATPKKKETKPKEIEKQESTSESEYENRTDKKNDSSDSSDDTPPQRNLRGVPGIRSAGKYWDPKSCTSSSEDSELESKQKPATPEKKKTSAKSSSGKSDTEKPSGKMKKTAGVPVKKKRNRNEVVMDLKDMVVQKRMASLNATAILAASYEKRSPKSNKDETTSDSCSDESFSQKSKNGVSSGVKSEVKSEDIKKDNDDTTVDKKQKVEVIVNQDTDVTITGVYSTHLHEGFCTVSGMQYRISATSHTQTTATANCDKDGCSREDGSRYTPLTALSSMQPPADHAHPSPHQVSELGGLGRRAAGCSSAFSAPSPAAHHEPGYYQPAGPLIKETGVDAERALARYHPPPHYHPPHPPVLQQYGPPYYPPDLCYGRYYRPPGPYHMPPQPDAQMVGVGGDPYPPPQYYGTPPCYQHSPQRIPYVEYRGCPCPLNACPKNVHIGPATGKAPTGGGPIDNLSLLAPPGGAFRSKVRACALDAGADSHGSGKDPPLEHETPAAADVPHPCPLPAIGGASPKRELFDLRDSMRLAGDTPGPAEALGPPSPARGSAGICAPQPPSVAPRRARLGKAMARRSLAGDDTALLLSVPQTQQSLHSDADDDVMAISPPVCAPIDLSSSDERTTPLVDVKKENEGPTYALSRKTDAQALREHNCTTALSDTTEKVDAAKVVKRKYSKSKLEIDMIDIQLEDTCKTNGIGEHVKLQKRRKVSGEQTNVIRTETVTKEPKKKAAYNTKKTPKTPTSEKKAVKRKLENNSSSPKAKKMLIMSVNEDPRLKNVAALPEDPSAMKPKNKSALLLDKLLRKNSIDRADVKGLNPAELFLSPSENLPQNCSKKTLNINNNIVENSTPISGVRPNTIAAVTQLIEKKLAFKNACKVEKVDSKVMHSLKSVLKTPNDKLKLSEDPKLSSTKCNTNYNEKNSDIIPVAKCDTNSIEVIKDKCETLKDNCNINKVNNTSPAEEAINSFKISKSKLCLNNNNESNVKLAEESHSISNQILDKSEGEKKDTIEDRNSDLNKSDKTTRCTIGIKKANGQMKNKSIERVAKLLVSKKPAVTTDESSLPTGVIDLSKEIVDKVIEKEKLMTPLTKRCKLGVNKTNDEVKGKSIEQVAKLLVSMKPSAKESVRSVEDMERKTKRDIDATIDEICELTKCAKRSKLSNGEMKEKVVKLLVSKRPALKTDEATLVVEDACAWPTPCGRRTRRRRSGARRPRRAPAPPPPPAWEPRAPPRWSNGWNWDGENYISKVYLNNDSRLDRTARCWPRMLHTSGDAVARGDCVLLRASTARAQPFVARVASLWQNPDDGEMMVSLVWYYRPEHTERGREPADAPDEVFASRHRDANSVACIEDKCYVLTFNEYCRYRKRLKAAEEGVTISPSIVPPLPPGEVTPAAAPNDTKLPPSVSPELVLFCRKIYDFRSKKIQVPNK